MRSIIFTSALCLALPVQAAAELACYARDYSGAHLAAHPAQVVDGLVVQFSQGSDYAEMALSAQIVEQGAARGSGLGGRWLDQFLYCTGGDTVRAGLTCFIECDGGRLEIVKANAHSLTFSSHYLTVGETESCAGFMEISEPANSPTLFRVNRVDASICRKRFK